MNRRKVSDVSRKQKSLGKRSSIVALHPNTGAIHPKRAESEALPPLEKGIQHGHPVSSRVSPNPPEIYQKPVVPKTKFTSNDRSSEFRCSPRLKSFPAEELRRFDASPRVESTIPPFQMTGDGETLHDKTPKFLQSQSMQNQCSDPEVFNVVPLERSPDRQQHRPCVPRPLNHGDRIITEHQSEGNFLKKKEGEELERQPIGGRTAAMFRQQISEPQQHIPTNAEGLLTDDIAQKNVPNRPHVQFSEHPQMISDHIPQEMYHQNYQQQFLQYPQQFPGLGMTSPQDVSMNQSRMHQMMQHHQQTYGHPEQREGPWMPNPGVNVPNPTAVDHHHQRRLLQQVDQVSWPQSKANPVRYVSATQQRQRKKVEQSKQREYPRQRGPEDQESSNVLEFTADMLRDQDKLVRILRQQEFPDEIVKRQFDGLLAEQRRQLIVLHQLKNAENASDDSKKLAQPRRRRITKVEEDEKPDWMMHITPPWVSYAALDQQKDKESAQEKQYQANERNRKDQQVLHEQQMHLPTQPQIPMMVNPVVYQQWQQQHMQNPAIFHSEQYAHPHHYQQVFNPQYHQYDQLAQPNISEAHTQHHQTFNPENHEELIPQDRQARVQPSSLLKLRTYQDVTKRQKQNNGLQDAATVKEAMEALKNPNRKGFEYLANMEKDVRQIRLNGAQDPETSLLQNWPHRPPDYVTEQSEKEARANGLENKRNPDNPAPTIQFHQNMNEPMPVYPKRVEGDGQFCSMTSAIGDNRINQNCTSALKNTVDPSLGYNDNFQAHVYNQVQGGTSGNHQGSYIVRSSSLPADMSQQRLEYFQEVPKSCLKGGQGDGNEQGLIQGQYYVTGHFEEPRVIGGVKYIGRKSKFIPNSYAPGQY